MSHHTVIQSPPGTPLADRTVGEIVAGAPSLSRVFQRHQIDFCCQGGKTLREACEGRGLDPAAIAGELEVAGQTAAGGDFQPTELSPGELIDHIVEQHHGFLRRELPRLHAMAKRVAQVHGGHTPTLVEVSDVFERLFIELDSHMMKEEQMLFPAIKALSGESDAASPIACHLDGPLSVMRHEHDDAGAALARLRTLTKGYEPPGDACNTYRALFAGLADLEEDLHRHIHLENSILFPAAEALAEAAGVRATAE